MPPAQCLDPRLVPGRSVGVAKWGASPKAGIVSRTLHNADFRNAQAGGALPSARLIVPLVLTLMEPRRPGSAIDFGCGLGAWLRALQEHGIQSVIGVDGDYVNRAHLLIEPHRFRAVNLECDPLDFGGFDLALCLEAAEHLPEGAAERLINGLTTAAPVVLFSAAVPGQGGTHHVNERWPSYWIKLFSGRGFLALDPIRPQIREDRRIDWTYRQNLLLFARAEAIGSYPALLRQVQFQAPVDTEWVCAGLLKNPEPVRLLKRAPYALLQLIWWKLPLSGRARASLRQVLGRACGKDGWKSQTVKSQQTPG